METASLKAFESKTIKLNDLGLEDHVCFLFSTEEEHRSSVSDFIRLGLERNEKVFCVLDAHLPEVIDGYLLCHALDFHNLLRTAQLQVARFVETAFCERSFDPERMIQWLSEEAEFALAQGWSGLRVTIEMSWLQRKSPGVDRLLEFERKLNRFLCHSKCMALCQYDQRQFSPLVLLCALITHPVAIVGTEIYDNLSYSIPASFMIHQPSSETLLHWLSDLGKHPGRDECL
jgi:hypothetical protein